MDMNPTPTSFLDSYLAFCANPLRSEQLLLQDLYAIVHHEKVADVYFHQPPQGRELLAITTTMVEVTNHETGLCHYIGEFVILLKRERVNRWWEVRFFVCNRSHNPTGERMTGMVGVEHQHPHMYGTVVDAETIVGLPVTNICIQHGRYPIFQAIRRARLYDAVCRIIDLLHTVEREGQYPSAHIRHWPLKE